MKPKPVDDWIPKVAFRDGAYRVDVMVEIMQRRIRERTNLIRSVVRKPPSE